MNRIKSIFKNKESVILLVISFALALNTLFIIPQKTSKLTSLRLNISVDIFYLLCFILSVSFLGTIYFFSEEIKLKDFIKKTLLVYLPAEIVLLYGLQNAVHFHPLFFITSATYLATGGIFLVFLLKNKTETDSSNRDFFNWIFSRITDTKNWFKSKGTTATLILFAVIALNVGFGAYHLGKFAAVDEPLWIFGRVQRYWKNLGEFDLKGTKVSDKPGIPVSIISGIGLLWENPQKDAMLEQGGEAYKDVGITVEKFNTIFRLPILLFNALMLFVFYVFLNKLLGKTTAVLALIFIGLSPILLGISTIVNPDSLLWTFLPLSILSYFLHIKERKNSYLYWAGIFLGLAILTKYVANILYVFFFGLIFLEYILNKNKYENLSVAEYFKRAFTDYLILVIVSLTTFLILLPSTWMQISDLLKGTILSQAFQNVWPIFVGLIGFVIVEAVMLKGKITSFVLNFFSRYKKLIFKGLVFIFIALIAATMINTYLGMKFYDFESILASPKTSHSVTSFLGILLANIYSLIFGINPLAFTAIVYLGIFLILGRKNSISGSRWSFYIIFFILSYYIASTADNVAATVRYQIVNYPLALILSAIGINHLINMELVKKYLLKNYIYLAVIIISVFSLYLIKPFYFSYASGLLPRQYVLNLKDMGDGSYEAAQYLNSLPNAKNLFIWTDKRGVCSFFIGRCSSDLQAKPVAVSFDYFVVSAGRESRTTKIVGGRFRSGAIDIYRLDKLYSIEKADWKLEIGGRPNNYVKIIRGSAI